MESKAEFVVFGHRGGVGMTGLGENTIPAFKKALQDGADGIEFDVYVAKDAMGADNLVVIHDETVDRTTNGSGAVVDFSFEQLRALRVGDEKTQQVSEYTERIPTAQEVIDAVLAHDLAAGTSTVVNVELKGAGTAKPTANLIHRYVNEGVSPEHFLVSSFDHPQLEEFHQIYNEIPTAILVDHHHFAAWSEQLAPAIELAKRLNSVAVNPGLYYMPVGAVDEIQKNGLRAYVWTDTTLDAIDKIDDRVLRARNMGADGVFSDNPSTGRAALERYLQNNVHRAID